MSLVRQVERPLREALGKFPVVGLIGARQVGKTTLARSLAETWPRGAVYLDLERPSDVAKLAEPELFLEGRADHLVVLDEVHRRPDLFGVLRALVDADRRPGRFLVLGSASPDLLKQSSESLAGRIVYRELTGLTLPEVDGEPGSMDKLWCRGGFPRSFLAGDDAESIEWRDAFMRTHVERDLPNLGIGISAPTLLTFWQMLAHSHGQLWNGSKIAASLGVSVPTVKHYREVLQRTFMVRTLQPFFANIKKRLVKAPKVYLRDSGLLHALLRLESVDTLLGHPIVGASWEGWAIEQIHAALPPGWPTWFYRTSAGAEIDLIVERPGNLAPLAIKIKRTVAPTLSKGFRLALADLRGARGLMVCPVRERFGLGDGVFTLPASELGRVDWRAV